MPTTATRPAAKRHLWSPDRPTVPVDRPVARVAVDLSLPHLDRAFDFAVPAALDAVAVPGSRVRVRFAGQLVGGFVLDRVDSSDHPGPLTPLVRSVSPEPVLTAEIAALAREVADRCAGTLADVLRLAVPPRHAAAEAAVAAPPQLPPAPPAAGGWRRYDAGAEFLDALAAGGAPRAVWTALPGPGWSGELAAAVAATLAGGRGALVVLPARRDLDRVDEALLAALGPGRHVALHAGLGPAERYRRFLAVRRGAVRAVVGTRASAFAPVADLGLVAVWDDGDDLHAEPRAPYPHVRDVLVLRAHRAGAAVLLGGFARSTEAELLVRSGWARPLTAPRAIVRAAAPHVEAAGGNGELARDEAARAARLPSLAWSAARAALAAGAPVLVQVPRRGYLPALACARCRAPARCACCLGPVGQAAASPDTVPACRWCGRPAAAWACPVCGQRRLRAAVVGARRTAEELGRAFPGVPVRTSGGAEVLARVDDRPAVVVATPGAEPIAAGGYGAVLLLDGWALLTRPDLRAGEETLRRWLGAAALARPAAAGGRVVVMADAGLRQVQALVRWDPAWAADGESEDRAALRFPPVTRMASITGAPAGVTELLAAAELPDRAETLGPVALSEQLERALVRVPRVDGVALAASLHAALAARSARKATASVRVEMDPLELV